MNNTEKLTGLNDEQVAESRRIYGFNLLTPPKKKSSWILYLEKFNDPIIRVLLIAAFLSLIISFVHREFVETIGIFCAVFLTTTISFWFERDADKKFDLLNRIGMDSFVKVLRNGNVTQISKKEVVVGDIVYLETGDDIPADGKLLKAQSLQIDESCLTGESLIDKTTSKEHASKEATYSSDSVLGGTKVMNGHGIMYVEKVGDATEYGMVAQKAMEKNTEETPLNLQLSSLARKIGILGIAFSVLIFSILFLKDVMNGSCNSLEEWGRVLNYFMVAVTLIVVSVPEGLPMSVTLTLTMNMKRMLKTNNLVRKMHACETMGAITVICTDKTGTLTKNDMRIYQTQFYALKNQQLGDDEYSNKIKENIAINTTAFLDCSDPNEIKSLGNPTETALLRWVYAQNVDYLELRKQMIVEEQIPFSTENKFMATLVQQAEGRSVLYLKGAPEIVLKKSTFVETHEGLVPIEQMLPDIEQSLLKYQNQAMRTLAFAYKEIPIGGNHSIEKMMDDGFSLMGIVAINDPVRKDVPVAVKECLDAGVEVKIVTGDTIATAREIARQIGIWTSSDTDRQIITGKSFESLRDEEAFHRVKELKVMCRARPIDKQRLVQLLQKGGAVVAVTGDGTNDAPALNHAHVGLSMGMGTAVAKEASDITLLDDSFASIATAVMWGRSLYQNIQRFVLFQLTINFTALILMLLGLLAGFELPLTVTQILWINLIMDTFAAAALSSLPPDRAVMKNKPRQNSDFIVTPSMRWNILFTGIVFLIFLLFLLYTFTNENGTIDRYHLSLFFTSFVMLQFWNMFNAKTFGTMHSAFFKMTESRTFLFVSLMIIVGQYLIVTFGGTVFRTEPLSWIDWLKVIGGTSVVLWMGEIFRWFRRIC